VRTSFDYVPSFKYGGTFRNVAASVGPVFSFGNRAVVSAVVARGVAVSHSSMSISSLGIMAVPRTEGGAEIVEVASGSVAELANLHVGDLITSVNGKAVNSPMELAAELQNRTPGSQVRLGYMFRSSALGYFGKETVVTLGANK